MVHVGELIGCHIIEKDNNNDILWTWIYPKISEDEQKLLLRKCAFDSMPTEPFFYGRLNKKWFYTTTTEVLDSDNLPGVKLFALILIVKNFNPEKYETLCKVLSQAYCKTGNPVEMQKLYWSVLTKGSCVTQDNGTFISTEFDSLKTAINVREIINTFELETILIYTAMLLKKRVIVYHHSLKELIKWIQAFPALMSHREPNDYLFPWVDLVPEETIFLKANNYFVAGVKDSSICSKTDSFDLLVNLPAREVTVSPQAKESLTMTKTHKDIAMFMVQLAQNASLSDVQVIQEISEKTQDLLNQLKSLATVKTNDVNMISLENLRSKNLNPAVENFLFNLAVAENIMML